MRRHTSLKSNIRVIDVFLTSVHSIWTPEDLCGHDEEVEQTKQGFNVRGVKSLRSLVSKLFLV